MHRYNFYKAMCNAYFLIIIIIFCLNFYIFGRLTIDDAFITFQYGKNLINSGVWNYNPIEVDISQSYSNALYAFISIIPHYFDIDVVLFFKIFSSISIIGTFLFFCWVCYWNKLAILSLSILYSMPFTVAHAFAGLETFMFVNFITFLFVALDKKKYHLSLFLTFILILIRQESYIFIIIVPIYFYFFNGCENKIKYYLPLFIFFLTILLYFSANFLYFGDFFSTSFYAKSVYVEKVNNELFKTIALCTFALCLIPLLFQYENFKENYATIFIVLMFVLILTILYSHSNLAMNYGKRFYFHIYYPIITFVIYRIYSKNNFVNPFPFKTQSIGRLYVLIFCTGLLSYQYFNDFKQQTYLANYYPRLISSHASIANKIAKMSDEKTINSILISDAGIVPYISDVINIDSFGLGNMKIAKEGLSIDILEQYDPSLIFLTTQIKTKKTILIAKYIENNPFIFNCKIPLSPNSFIQLWSKYTLENCNEGSLENYNDVNFFKTHISRGPFYFWSSFKSP